MKKRYVFLDRDGTIIVNKHYQRDPDLTELLPNAAPALHLFKNSGFGMVLITNQSGIGRGLLTEDDMRAVNRRMVCELGGGDDFFDGIYFCPHLEQDACGCRKPKIGMLEAAARDLGIILSKSCLIGDSASDIAAGNAAGATTVLVRTGYGEKTLREGTIAPDHVADDLLDAAEWIIGGRAADAADV